MSKRDRSTKKQIEAMVSYITEHTEMANNNSSVELDKLWENLKNILNASDGPSRSVKQWKTVFADLKTNTKRKARLNCIGLEGTGGGPNTTKPLTEIENRIISLIKPVTIEGVAVPEPGLVNEQFDIENMEIVTLDNIDIDENISPVNEPQTPKLTKNKKPRSRAAWHTKKYNADIKALAISNNNVARALNNVARAIQMYSRSTR